MWNRRSLAPALLAVLIAVFSSPAWAKITVDLQASRVSGAAPLAVQFNASGTKHSNGSVDTFRQVFYTWDFGERATGRNPGHWRHGISEVLSAPLSKDEDCCSPISAHVYDLPGTYTATVTARDRAGTIATKSVTITVRDPDTVWSGGSTVCVSASGNFSGCPAGARQVKTSDFAAALQSQCGIPGNRPVRCLFRRGEKFFATRKTRTGDGPHLIGAFGNGAAPVIDHSNNLETSLISPNGDDIRIMDLSVTRSRTADGTTFVSGGSGTHVLVYRTEAEGSDQIFSSGTLTCDHGVNGHWFIVENDVGPTRFSRSGNGIMWAGRRQTFMGNVVHDTQSSPGGADGHVVRIQCLQDFYIGHNTFAPGEETMGAPLSLRAPRHDRDGGIGNLCANNRDCVIPPDHPGCSQRNVVTGNYINGGAGGFGVSSASFDGCIQDNVIERHYDRVPLRSGWEYQGRRGTMRNIVMSYEGALKVGSAITLRTQDDDSPSMHLRDNEVYDVHVYAANLKNASAAATGFRMSCGPQIKEVKIHNFFIYAPGYSTRVLDVEGSNCKVLAKEAVCSSDVSDSSRTCTVQGNPFGGKPDSNRLDTLLIASGSNMLNAGSLNGSLFGILGNRVVDGKPDVGAAEAASGGVVQLLPPLLLPRQ